MTATATPPAPEAATPLAKLPVVSYVDDKTAAWREQVLAAGGFDAELAALLAPHGEVDLHEAVALRTRGCPAELVAAILL